MVLSMGFFGAFCGSILAGITAIGSILIPPMFKAGYPKPFVIVLAACAAILEALIPPSNTAIIYSALTHVPVSKTFAAGLLPGFVLMALLCLYVVVKCWSMPRPAKADLRDRVNAVWAAVPALFTPVIILGGIYSGLFTAAESAAVAAVWGIVLGIFIYRELTWQSFYAALKGAVITTTIIFAIIGMAIFLSVILTFTQAPQGFVEYLSGLGVTPITFLLMVALILLVLGTFLEVIPVFYLTLPILIPVAMSLEIDLLHFYVFFTAFVAIGMLTPPVCVGVYVAAAVANEPPASVFRAVPPFLALGCVYGLIMMFFPQLATWIPSLV
jgi:C4-dicarboxylate transporter DctM subunit